jgi:hypothetical protein
MTKVEAELVAERRRKDELCDLLENPTQVRRFPYAFVSSSSSFVS